jgi:glutamine---fructose-6-phosphate transaminase (isomerizing)
MCGIFGLVAGDVDLRVSQLKGIVDDLFLLSESRGKEASGIALLINDRIWVYKEPIPASQFIKKRAYREFFDRLDSRESSADLSGRVAIIGHSRLVTNGQQEIWHNNQPVVCNGLVGVHNGIVVNHENIRRDHLLNEHEGELDSEVIFGLLDKFNADQESIVDSVRKVFGLVEGMASIASFDRSSDHLLLATNNGSLYCNCGEDQPLGVFASEKYILESLIKKRNLARVLNGGVKRVEPGSCCLLGLDSAKALWYSLDEQEETVASGACKKAPREIVTIGGEHARLPKANAVGVDSRVSITRFPKEDGRKRDAIDRLKRCTRCILPETIPFIDFDGEGVCNFCRNYQARQPNPRHLLEERLAPYRRIDGQPDCIVSVSGGRDSSYALHYVKSELGMNPLAFTYDWGMVTDLARRNISRMCGQLGVEHILVSADIDKKRKNIRKNVEAWLRKPDLGIIPLFMAGDKAFFYYANKIKEQTGIGLDIWSTNDLEKTDFKVGFCGIAPENRTGQFYRLKLANKAKLAFYYGKQFVKNRALLNGSLLDTSFAFFCYYFAQQNHLLFFDYVDWEEEQIEQTLIQQYSWETASDTSTTWRIGDGTAAFYNYIYYSLAGFTENDTFRSNQIREGLIAREEALRLTRRDNEPRFDAMSWYCDTLDIDMEAVIATVDRYPKLYALPEGSMEKMLQSERG